MNALLDRNAAELAALKKITARALRQAADREALEWRQREQAALAMDRARNAAKNDGSLHRAADHAALERELNCGVAS